MITAANQAEAKKIAQALVAKKFAACVNILGRVQSLFWWKSKVDSAQEVLLLVKSRRENLNKIIKLVKTLHSYDVPEIIALPIIGGSKAYLDWIDASLR
jgi:periplasmic divalent cation tolerance protein